jgi:NitT/TauT family transport system permease protein
MSCLRPVLIGQTIVADWSLLFDSLLWTCASRSALSRPWSSASTLAVLFTQSKWLEMSLFPYAVVLQVTPVVSIAPLIIIWSTTTDRSRC